MSGENIGTLFELLNKFSDNVEIPIVQRDYAQGRKTEKIQLVRDNLLADMKAAVLKETPPLDLNFVYGKSVFKKEDEGKFIPVDGQQRLTTLFLLHLYAFRNDETKTNLLNRFTYETRTSSRDFLKKLTQHRALIFASDLPPSEEIADSEWFVSGWKNDPTIQSVFVMLDGIKNEFGDIEDLADRLLDNEYKPLIFQFHDMDNLGMEDSLYIKLNARGKPLTPFENFKARLVGCLKKLLPDLALEFEHHFDTTWADLFWTHSKEKFDQMYLAFFGVLLMNKETIRSDANWSNRLDFSKIDKDVFRTAFHTLNYLCKNPKSQAAKLIFDALGERPIYPQRVLFHAVTTYLYESEGIDDVSFRQWLRIVQNLTLNTNIDVELRYRSAIDGINKLAQNWNNLLEYFAKDGAVTFFMREQIAEEQTKAKIILADANFADAIYDAEKHPYFSGQIRAALTYAVHNNTATIGIFTKYWNKIAALFDSTKPRHGHLMRRTLLTFGDYTLPVDNNNYRTLCVDDPKEGASTPSLKRLFSNCGLVVKEFLDSIVVDKDIDEQLKTIIKESNL